MEDEDTGFVAQTSVRVFHDALIAFSPFLPARVTAMLVLIGDDWQSNIYTVDEWLMDGLAMD